MASSPQDVENIAKRLIGTTMYTEQTGTEGNVVRAVSICE